MSYRSFDRKCEMTTHITLRVFIRTRKRQRHLNVPGGETELVSALQHHTPILQPMVLHVLHQYTQLAVLRCDLTWIIPFLVSCSAIPEIYSLPVGIIARIEHVSIHFKFVGEDLGFTVKASPCFRRIGCGYIN